MAFAVRRIDSVTFRALYTSGVARQLDPFIRGAHEWMRDQDNRRWALDRHRGAFLLRTPLKHSSDTRLSFSLVWQGRVALAQQTGIGRYRILYASPMGEERWAAMTVLMKRALPLGYGLLSGVIRGGSGMDLPEPEFVVG